MAGTVGLALEQTIYAVTETTSGTLAYPTVAGEKIVGAGYGEINQQPAFSDSEDIVNSLDVLTRFQDQTGAGTFTVPIYVRPGGALGTAPMGAALYESLYGVETINASTSVVYTQATTKPSFSLWMHLSHTLFFARGATVASGALNITNAGGAMITFSGGFMELGWAGTSTVSGAVTADTAVAVATGTGKRYTVGARVMFDTDDNSNAGYEITAVSGDDLTIGTAATISDGAVIKGFLPVFTTVGTPLENRAASVTFDAVATKIKSVDITMGTPVDYLVNELTTSGYPTDFIPGKRDISGTTNIVFRSDDVGYFYDGKAGTVRKDTKVTIGSVPGDIAEFNYPSTQLEVPATSVDGSALALSIGMKALATGNGENSATLTFT